MVSMNTPAAFAPRLVKWCLALAVLAAGCSRGQERTLPSTAQDNLRVIGMVYHQASLKNGHAPRDAEELKPAMQRLKYPEQILVSPNDGQPYTICWGVTALQPGAGSTPPVLAYESVGVEGKKYVMNGMLVVTQMSDQELQQALQIK
jgi:hypothetical protein